MILINKVSIEPHTFTSPSPPYSPSEPLITQQIGKLVYMVTTPLCDKTPEEFPAAGRRFDPHKKQILFTLYLQR